MNISVWLLWIFMILQTGFIFMLVKLINSFVYKYQIQISQAVNSLKVIEASSVDSENNNADFKET